MHAIGLRIVFRTLSEVSCVFFVFVLQRVRGRGYLPSFSGGRAAMRSCVLALLLSHLFAFVPSWLRVCVRSFVCACVRSCLRAFVRSCVLAQFARSSVRALVLSCSCAFVRACVRSCVRAYVHACVHAYVRLRMRVLARAWSCERSCACVHSLLLPPQSHVAALGRQICLNLHSFTNTTRTRATKIKPSCIYKHSQDLGQQVD